MKITITKEEYAKIKEELAKEQSEPMKKPFKFKWPWAKRSAMNKSVKKNDEILAFILNLKHGFEGPILTKIYGGNFLVIRNRVYRYNPGRVFTMGKYKVVLAREFDRELIGIEDYDNLIAKDEDGNRVNINDPILIKAVLNAHLSEKPAMAASKWIWIALIAVSVIVGFFLLTGKKSALP